MSEESSAAADMAAILQDYVPRADYEAALEALQEATEEAGTHRQAAEAHTERLAELEGKVRGRSYRDAYDKLAKDAKVRDEFKDDAFRLLGVEQDADEPDEKAMKKALDEFLKERKHYTDADDKARPKQIPAGEGATRGRSGSPGEPEFRVSKRERNDALWMRENGQKFREASKAGLLVLDED